ncbi:MAG: hypothetical protein JWM53_5236 [bacterium]|nr:hypothetical protein [bacterium]
MAGSRSKTTRDIDEPLIAPRAAKSAAGTFLPWRPATPRDGESVRWQCVDGRWIAIGLASGKRAGLAFVLHSGVLCEYVDSYEAALALAKKWRTV